MSVFENGGREAGDIPNAIPAGKPTLVDLLKAADRAVIVDDVHGARRLIAEALERCGVPDWQAISRRVGSLGKEGE